MALPNFLIVGGAKCGSSSLAKYLSQHPDVFISDVKEPRFISSQFTPFPLNGPKDAAVEAWYVKDFESYAKLFEGAEEKAIGEASVDNLYFYEQAIPTIKQFLGEPKIIIMLRNPVKRAFSAYQHMIRDEREPLSFEEALQQENERERQNWEFLYYYTSVSLYFKQVKAYMDSFPNVKVVLTEDMSKSPDTVLSEVFGFLGVDPSFRVAENQIKYNLSGVPKNKYLYNLVTSEDSLLRRVSRPIARGLFSKGMREKIAFKVLDANFEKLSLEKGTEENLRDLFRGDIHQLEGLLGRDLKLWY